MDGREPGEPSRPPEDANGLISDFFDHIIWDILNNVMFEVGTDVSLIKLRDEVKAAFIRRLTRRIDNEGFEKEVRERLHENNVDPTLSPFFLNLLWQFLGKLTFYFDNSPANEANVNLREIVHEYILVSYYENVVLAPIIKLLFLNKNTHYGVIYGFKVKCQELFKAALDKQLSLDETKQSFREEVQKLRISPILQQSVEAVLFSFFETLSRVESWDSYVQNLKRILDQKKPLLKFEESEVIKAKGEFATLLRWFTKEGLDHALAQLQGLGARLDLPLLEARKRCLEAFHQLILGNLTYDGYEERVWKVFKLKQEPPDGAWKEVYAQAVLEVLVLGQIAWDERRHDPSLHELIKYVKDQEQMRRDMFV
ncbi:MAG: hypothetical protein Kow0069_36740 [Promethearchaeota archaeon]